MPRLDQVTKFEILTELKHNQEKYASMTMIEIQQSIKQQFNSQINKSTLSKWAKIYSFKYKAQRKTKANEIQKTNQRIHTLSIVVRNLCRELNLKHPSILDRLIDGIELHYGKEDHQEETAVKIEKTILEAI